MKTPIICTLSLALIGGLTAHAEGDKGEKKRQVPPAILEKFDANGDGKLNEEERKAAREAMKQRQGKHREAMIKKFDADGDGELNEEERKAAREAMKQRREEMIKKYDTDGDGKLSKEERKAAREAGAGPQGPRKGKGKGKLDRDGEG